jgi:uncharacterized protein involved in exopolysaccharide biosynthesis
MATNGRTEPERTGDSIDFIESAATLLRRWRLLAGVLVLAALGGVAHYFFTSQDYVAESRFRPAESGADMGRLAGIAAQFGINYAMGGESESIDFYAELLRSRELLAEVLLTGYEVQRPNGTPFAGTYLDYNNINHADERIRLGRGLRHLRNHVAISTNAKSGIVTIRTEADTPELAEHLNRVMLDRVNAFNLERRQSKSAAERVFVEEQLAASRAELAAAERELETFLESNRRMDVPYLQFQDTRLRRQVETRLEVYRSLSQNYEKARIDEVRDIPVITVVDSPERSARRTGSRKTSALLALVPGFILATTAVFGTEHVARARRRRPEQFAEFDAAGRRVAATLRLRRIRVGAEDEARR